MKKAWIFLSIFISASCIPFHLNAVDSHHQKFGNEQEVFIEIAGNRIKVDPNSVYILLNDELIPLPELGGGRRDNYYVWECPICGTINVQTGEPCSNSSNHPKESS